MKSELHARNRYKQTEKLMNELSVSNNRCLNCGNNLGQDVNHNYLCQKCRNNGYDYRIEVGQYERKKHIRTNIILLLSAVLFFLMLIFAMVAESLFDKIFGL